MSESYTTSVVDEAFSAALEQAREMQEHLVSPEALAAQHGDVEEYLTQQGREFQRRLLQAHLVVRARLEQRVDVRGADGVRRGYARPSHRFLGSVFGSVSVLRLAYQREGVDGLHPLDAMSNLPDELYSHGLRRLVAETAARNSFEDTREIVLRETGMHIGKRQLEQLAARASIDFDAFYARAGLRPEQEDPLLVLTFDGKGIIMRTEDLREATRQAAEKSSRKLDKRLSKGEKRNRKRMAQVASIYSLPASERDAEDVLYPGLLRDPPARPRPQNKLVWASVATDPKQVIWQTFEEGLRRDPARRRRWVVLVDGHPEQLALVKWAARKAGVQVTIVLDVMHVLEYLWKAAFAFYDEGSDEASRWVHQRLRRLLKGRSGGELARTLRRQADDRGLSTKACQPVERCAKYLLNKTRYLHYDRALAEGLPIATGVIEGACRHLVASRMDSARWSLPGAEAILRLRALVLNGDFADYWRFHVKREHERNHLTRYAGNVIPLPFSRGERTQQLPKAA